ncbi:GNAT family N-acetyltransferase [Ureibacillus composti]
MGSRSEAIYEGAIGDKPFKVHLLNQDHLPQIVSVQEDVYNALPDKNSLQPLSNEELLYILNGNGIMIGAFINEELIAFRALLIPIIDEEHLGYDIGLTEESDLKRVLYQEISNVHPNYRGFGLQKTLAIVIMQQVDPSAFDVVCATVMPYNIASLKDKFSQGMHVAALKYKYNGKLRYVFAKPLHTEIEYEDEVISKAMSDVKGQQALVKNGYFGVSMKQVDHDWVVEYRKGT